MLLKTIIIIIIYYPLIINQSSRFWVTFRNKKKHTVVSGPTVKTASDLLLFVTWSWEFMCGLLMCAHSMACLWVCIQYAIHVSGFVCTICVAFFFFFVYVPVCVCVHVHGQSCVQCTHSRAQIAPEGPRDHRLPKGKGFPRGFLFAI